MITIKKYTKLILFLLTIIICSSTVFAGAGLPEKPLYITNSYFTTGVIQDSNNFIRPQSNTSIGNHFRGTTYLVLNTFINNGEHRLFAEVYDKNNNLIAVDKMTNSFQLENDQELTAWDFGFTFNIENHSDYYYVKLYDEFNGEKTLIDSFVFGGVE